MVLEIILYMTLQRLMGRKSFGLVGDFVFSYSFMFFMFWEKRDIKESKNIYLTSFLTDVDNSILTELTLSR